MRADMRYLVAGGTRYRWLELWDLLAEDARPQAAVLLFVQLVDCAAQESNVLDNVSGAKLLQRLEAGLDDLAPQREPNETYRLCVEGVRQGQTASEQRSCELRRELYFCEQGGNSLERQSSEESFAKSEAATCA